MPKRCRVVCDTESGPRECELELPDGATVGAALEEARSLMQDSRIDWHGAATGIFGRLCPREHVPADGDRIELYRNLQVDPRQIRRERAAHAARTRGRR